MDRDQLGLFPEKLDNAIAPDHPVRLLDDILNRLDWSKWEETYVLVRGHPPIHPKVVAGAMATRHPIQSLTARPSCLSGAPPGV